MTDGGTDGQTFFFKKSVGIIMIKISNDNCIICDSCKIQ